MQFLARLKKINFLTLTMFFVVNFSIIANAATITEQKFNTHLRWNFFVPKNQLLVTKTSDGFILETLNLDIFQKLQKELENINIRKDYFSKVNFSSNGFPERPAKITVTNSTNRIELFSFYRQKEKKYVLDFWKTEEEENAKVSKLEKRKKGFKPSQSTQSNKVVNKLAIQKKEATLKIKKTNNISKKVAIERKDLSKGNLPVVKRSKEFRDFRYGGSHIWNNPPLLPTLKAKVDLRNKTPEYFYPIKDRNLEEKGDREAHIQLSINLYRKEKYGLMAKSIRLFEKKYGTEKDKDINEYLKANAIIRENLFNNDKGPLKSAMAILTTIIERTKNYELKKGILLYTIQYLLAEKSYIDSLQMAKKLYIESRDVFDRETTEYCAKIIFFSLAELKQIEKIEKFSKEKTVRNLVAPQTLYAYRFLVMMNQGNAKKVIRVYEKNKKSFQKPIDSSILYNVAEAYFRESKYEQAVKLFDQFVSNYSFMTESSFARVRMALSYEIMEKETPKVLNLYMNAINRSSHPKARYEAKVRYVSMLNARKYKPTKADIDVMSFLEHTVDEKKYIDDDMKILLWLTRLRSFINKKQYREALSYITTLPVKTLRPVLKRMFQGDGAEIVYGMIQESFNKGNYPRVVKLWEIYRDMYEDKVAGEPYLNFLVAQSYINLGLEGSLDRTLDNLEKIKTAPKRSFPHWVERIKYGSINTLISEINVLKLIQKRNWKQVVREAKNLNTSPERKVYYQTIASYKVGAYKDTVKLSENFLRNTPKILPLNKQEINNFFESYLSSLYALDRYDRFLMVTDASLKDLEKSESETYKKLIEKMRYLYVETLYASRKSNEEIEMHAKKFIGGYKGSTYRGRVQYLLAKSLVENKRNSEGAALYNQLIDDESTADYIKEMSKTELASLKLDEKILN